MDPGRFPLQVYSSCTPRRRRVLNHQFPSLRMDFQGPHSTLRRLLDSGEHSDLTLTCQGEEFKLHKAVVCLQSPVIATALRGNFKVWIVRMNSEISSTLTVVLGGEDQCP